MERLPLVLLCCVVVAACSEPPSKSGSNANSSTTNGSASNGATNNPVSTNGQNNFTNSGPRELRASDFSQSCMFDSDCTLVFEGDQCQCGGSACPNAAISSDEEAAWASASENACAPDEMEPCSEAPCVELLGACVDGMCTVRTPVYVDTADWDTSCQDDNDCTIVFDGGICSSCVCGGSAVNISEIPRYEQLLEERECTPGPSACDCATVDRAWCNAGTCEPGVDPVCAGADADGFFSDCSLCPDNCDTIDSPQGTRRACGCESSGDCPCGLRCGDYELAPNVVVGNVCVR